MSKVNIIVEKKKALFDAFMDLEKVHGRIVERAREGVDIDCAFWEI